MSGDQDTERPKARLFFALDIPDGVRDGVAAWQRAECTDPALRVMPPQSLHITLAFLGWRFEDEIEAIGDAGMPAAGEEPGAPEVRFAAEVARRPPRGRPRLFALDAESRGAVAIQAELGGRLEAAGLHEPERRAFWPHVTVARVRRAGRGSDRPARVGREPGRLPGELTRSFGAVRIALYRSHLRPQGAEYAPLRTVELT